MPHLVCLTIYYSLIYSYLHYCCIIWGNACHSIIKPLQILQNRAVRLLSNKGYRDTATPLYSKLSIIKIENLAEYLTLLFVKRFLINDLPAHMLTYFSYYHKGYINTRSRDIFKVPYARTNWFKNSILIKGPTLWNNLPSNLQSINSLSLFKALFEKHTIQVYS